MALVGLLGLIPIAVGLVCLFFPQVIQRLKLDGLKHDPFGECFRSGVEGEGFITMTQVLGGILVLFGLMILVFAK